MFQLFSTLSNWKWLESISSVSILQSSTFAYNWDETAGFISCAVGMWKFMVWKEKQSEANTEYTHTYIHIFFHSGVAVNASWFILIIIFIYFYFRSYCYNTTGNINSSMKMYLSLVNSRNMGRNMDYLFFFFQIATY